ncbi:MAG: GTP-binding protein [Pirellulales bacterium]|nr:GTP-binding protein [Pirellulales bacterium]
MPGYAENWLTRRAKLTQATVSAVLTPLGRGAVATIGVAGPNAAACVDQYFSAANGLSLERQPLHAIRYGRWQSTGLAQTSQERRDAQLPQSTPSAEDLVICRFPTHVELHCHGGTAAVQAIMANLQAAGAMHITGREWIDLHSPSCLEAAIQAALGESVSETAVLAILAQESLWREELASWITLLDQCGPLVAPLADMRELSQRLKFLHNRLHELSQTARWAKHWTTSWRVTLAGPPNAGKSMLLNSLLGYQRAIVSDMPGTTRDMVTGTIVWCDWRIELRDTAGLRAAEDEIEQAGIARTASALQQADCVVAVMDLSEPQELWPLTSLRRICQSVKSVVLAANKCDLIPDRSAQQRILAEVRDFAAQAAHPFNAPTVILTSARDGQGCAELLDCVCRQLCPVGSGFHGIGLFNPDLAEDLAVWSGMLGQVDHDLKKDELVMPNSPALLAVEEQLRIVRGEISAWLMGGGNFPGTSEQMIT